MYFTVNMFLTQLILPERIIITIIGRLVMRDKTFVISFMLEAFQTYRPSFDNPLKLCNEYIMHNGCNSFYNTTEYLEIKLRKPRISNNDYQE